jgi:hypothetical protein
MNEELHHCQGCVGTAGAVYLTKHRQSQVELRLPGEQVDTVATSIRRSIVPAGMMASSATRAARRKAN